MRELNVPIVRYPGGNFCIEFFWEDSVYPKGKKAEEAGTCLEEHETNEIGIGEFSRWAKKADTDIMMAVNLGTRGIADACNLLEYCNHPSGNEIFGHEDCQRR